MPSQQRPTREHLATLIDQVLRALRPQVYGESPLMELTLPQFRTLSLLHAQGSMRMSEISCHLSVGMPTVTNLVSKLEKKGLVIREHDTRDRRVVFCSATDQGRAEVEQLWYVHRQGINRIINSLSEEEVKLAAKAMELILQAAPEEHQVD